VNKVFLILHILAVVIAIGPIAVATSMFPRALRQAEARPYDPGAVGALGVLNRICRVYAVVSVAVPLFGFALAGSMKVFDRPWLMISIILTAADVVVLLFLLPLLRRAVERVEADGKETPGAATLGAAGGAGSADVPAGGQSAARIAMVAGLFNILWVAVAVLMVTRP
jgi:hypothetical protein